MGVLSDSVKELAEALKDVDGYDRKACYEYVCDRFLVGSMARNYLGMYEQVLNGEQLNVERPRLVIEEGKFLSWVS